MPLYDYRCEACGVFEAMRKLAERDCPVPCSTCGVPADRIQASVSLLLTSNGNAPDTHAAAGSYGMRHWGGCRCCR
ncbi:zinc ribbon domain-containing protein [Paraburkholderia flagellata]|uniref:zinc ribbon domain-containing protein n=1 Tax=Paraburkholderia flagellata TaxID=2883241 RepID=UPI002279AFAB|nr:zinc ribbon domain-containing protein [Paraburkholderia flagellata]